MINICICDDDEKYSSKLEEYITKYLGQVLHIDYNIDIFQSGDALISNITANACNYQLLFLDIEMDGLNGIEVATYIRKYDKCALIIYVTSYDKYTIESFSVSPFRYLLKPIQIEQFEDILTLAVNEIMLANQYLFFKFQNIQYQVKYENIISIQSQGGRIITMETNTKKEKYSFYGKIKELEKQLNPIVFIKINAGVFVNFHFIHIISGLEIHMENGEIYTISRSRNKEVKQAYNAFLKRKLGLGV